MLKPPRYYYNSWGGWGDLGTNTSIILGECLQSLRFFCDGPNKEAHCPKTNLKISELCKHP